jgi:hypothetical protein
MTKNRKQKSSTRTPVSPGPAGVSPRNATARTKAVPSAARYLSKGYAGSARPSAKENTTARDTASANGNAPGKIPRPGKTRPGADSIDWRYLTPDQWPIVMLAINYYLSTFVSAESRAPIERVREDLTRQEPTV